MAELLNPNSVEYVPVPSQEKPVATAGAVSRIRSRLPSNQPKAPTFITRTGPPILLLPHDPSGGQQQPQQGDQAPQPQPAEPPQPRLQQPVQQRRGGPVRLAVPHGADPFFRAVVERPEDAAPRLVLADWLEERGDPRHLILRGHRPMMIDHSAGPYWSTQLGATGDDDYHAFSAHPHHAGAVHVRWWPPIGEDNSPAHTPQWNALLSPADALAVAEHIGHADRMPWLREMAARAPERFAAAQAPPGGMLSRGINYPAGQFTPAPMPAPPPAAPAPRKRTRLRELLRRPSMKMARPVLDPDLVRGMREAGADNDPWLRFADHLEEQGMTQLARSLRGETGPHASHAWVPGESWERPDSMTASGFPSWDHRSRSYHALEYWPDHGVATSRLKPYINRVSDEGNAERVTLVRGHEAIRDLAAEMEQNQLEDGEGDWAAEYAAIKDEAARRAGGAT